MRDLETISTALTAAETGHLVFGTLHTQSAPSTIDRIIDVFPAEQQAQVRMQLANTLQGIVTQTLLPTLDGKGRVAALEILFLDDAIRNLIRQGKIEQVYSYMQTGTQPRDADDGAVAHRARPEAARHHPRSGRPLEPPGSTRVGARARRHSDPRPVQRRRTRRHAGSRRGAAGGRELAANDPVEPPERVLQLAAPRPATTPSVVVRSVAHRRSARPGLGRPAIGFGDTRVGVPPASAIPAAARSASRLPRSDDRAALSHRDLVQAPSRAAARERRRADQPEEPWEPWQTPASGSLEDTVELDASDGDAPESIVVDGGPGG